MKLRCVRGLLWIIRSLGCDLLVDGHLIYQWVKTPDGQFDHWIASPTQQCDISETLERYGFGNFVWDIVVHSRPVPGYARPIYNNAQRTLGLMYACHRRRELLSDGTFGSGRLDMCESAAWLFKSINLLDSAMTASRDEQVRTASMQIRSAARDLAQLLAKADRGEAAEISTCVVNSIKHYDQAALASRDGRMKAAGGNLRAAVLNVLDLLAKKDPRVATILHDAFPGLGDRRDVPPRR